VATQSEEKGASIHFLRPRARRPDGQGVHFVLRIDNYPHLLRAYGPEVARSALGELNRILADFFRDDGLVAPEPDGRLEILLWSPALLGKLPLENACENWVHSFCAAIAMVPIECADERLHLALSGAWTKLESIHLDVHDALASPALHALDRVRFSGEAPGHGDDWIARYRRDMVAAAELFGAIDAQESVNAFAAIDSEEPLEFSHYSARQLALAWQPVRGAGDATGVLYYECLIRLIDSGGGSAPPDGLLESLERLGLVRALDHYILSAVIAELEQHPDVTLAANISAQSAQFDGWWQDIEQRLAADRSVAQRLVIEITETTVMPDIAAAAEFVSRMRSLGCLIALDDFGTGFASIRQLLALKPDIAKIDRLFLARAGLSRQDCAAFTHLVGLADALAPIVIVEGVESDEQCQLAIEAGAMWQQGYHHGRPSLTRTWRWSPEGVAGASLRGSSELRANASASGRSS
tara:strand:- start:1546 stop:2946 length:1401 start_codon:yes stop_codon:yes gene_type:complete